MTTKSSETKSQAWMPTLSQLLDWVAPVVAILLTAILIMERTPRKEPLLYGALLATLVALTWASARSRGHYGLWALYIGAFAIFGVVRSFADETGVPTHIEDLIAAEKTLSFGIVPTVWLQGQLFDPAQIGWVDRAAAYVHWSYFVLPHLFAAHLFLGHRHLFERYVLLWVGVLTAGLLISFIFPAAPPWAASLTGHLDPTYKVVTEVGSEFNVNLYSRFESSIRSSNPVAAMPSVHMAISFVVLLTAFRVNWILGVLALAYNVAMAFSLVYAGEHYVVDIVAGALVALAVFLALEVWFRLRDSRAAPLPAPTADPAPIGARAMHGPPAEPGMQA
jgi:membrane-associated phospholipid phosphatase